MRGVDLTTLAADFVPSPEQLQQILQAEKFQSATRDFPRMDLSTEEVCMKLYILETRLDQLEAKINERRTE